ncbi:unnamed protein product [Kuraishia capsulata CBS 1993]|uniref:RAVE complex protein Rav1 C-terminal domain-containing protein n=1 Tax=Kuraishia capsulata CBS 1993 TaxID=1382522 RepID=W6MGH0_9ASCO|nr:uncharacterized protein KUCA_T00001166001 [Kuraishia capsulata CBS 1993]CDK25199.1 unnamed protein product [Kuraishia capsulata CBS 1993]
MTLNFLPGEPNRAYSAVALTNWNALPVFAYCSGNNLVILTDHCHHLQTIYLDRDATAVDIHRVNGKIALAIGNEIHVYKPHIKNFYSFNFSGRKDISKLEISWGLETVIINEDDSSKVNCLNWSDSCDFLEDDMDSQNFFGIPDEYNSETTCELVVGSEESLTLWRLFYRDRKGNKTVSAKRLWFKRQANPVYMVKFSPNSNTIASIGFYDTALKLWHRVAFGIETSEFDVVYLRHSSYITNLRWKGGTNSWGLGGATSGAVSPTASSVASTRPSRRAGSVADIHSIATTTGEREHNVLYTYESQSVVKVWTMFFAEGDYQVLFSGTIDLYEGVPEPKRSGSRYCVIIDNDIVEYGLQKMLDNLEEDHESKHRKTSVTSGNLLHVPLEEGRSRSGSTISYYRKKEEHLARLQSSNFELVMVIDEDSNVSLYGLVNVSHILPGALRQFKLEVKSFHEDNYGNKHVPFPAFIKLGENCLPKREGSLFFQDISLVTSGRDIHKDLTLMIHDVARGSIRHVAIGFEDLFQFEPIVSPDSGFIKLPSPSQESDLLSAPKEVISIGTLVHKFTGHNKSIQQFIRSNDGAACLSVTRFCESYVWYPITVSDGGVTLSRKALLKTKSPIKYAVILQGGDFVVTLTGDVLTCWDCRIETVNQNTCGHTSDKLAVSVGSLTIKGDQRVLSLLVLPETKSNVAHIVAIKEGLSSEAWELVVSGGEVKLMSFSTGQFPFAPTEVHLISPVDPVGWTAKVNKGSPSERDMLAIIDSYGSVMIYSVSLKDNQIAWILKSSFKTGISNATQIKGSSLHKLAIVDENCESFSVWDTRGCLLEYEESVKQSSVGNGQKIKDIDWTCTDHNQSVLAVGFSSCSILYTQLRYDYTNDTPSYRAIKLIDISEQTTHEIGDSLWLKNGTLVIGAGNQIYVSDQTLDPENDILTQQALGTIQIMTKNLFHLCRVLNGPLPAYHPQLIIQMLFLGRFKTVEKILCVLCDRLREISLDPNGDVLRDVDPTLGLLTSDFAALEDSEPSKGTSFSCLSNGNGLLPIDQSPELLSPAMADTLLERLRKMKLPFLTSHQQITLASTIEIIMEIMLKHSQSLDVNGMRFFLGMKLFQVNQSKSTIQGAITMRDINFAMHSDNKDILLNIVESQGSDRMTWAKAKSYGLPYWLPVPKLMEMAESIARNEFLEFSNKNDGKRDPAQCSIFYLALKKKHVLQGLWRTSVGNPEQQKMMKFLANNFSDPRWKSAALKNAYVLLGRHRFKDAASFFLLADSLKDCVNVVVKQMKDIPLAILVAICYEQSDKGSILSDLLKDYVLSEAMVKGDRWTASWVFWKLGNRPLAIQALVKHSHELVEDPGIFGENVARTAKRLISDGNGTVNRIMEDPVLLVMYDNLRSRHLDYLKGALGLTSKDEFEFVLRVSYYYTRMGCDYISVYLVRNWKFMLADLNDMVKIEEEKVKNVIVGPSPAAFSSSRKKDFSNKIQPPPSAFVEPDMSAFDFGM